MQGGPFPYGRPSGGYYGAGGYGNEQEQMQQAMRASNAQLDQRMQDERRRAREAQLAARAREERRALGLPSPFASPRLAWAITEEAIWDGIDGYFDPSVHERRRRQREQETAEARDREMREKQEQQERLVRQLQRRSQPREYEEEVNPISSFFGSIATFFSPERDEAQLRREREERFRQEQLWEEQRRQEEAWQREEWARSGDQRGNRQPVRGPPARGGYDDDDDDVWADPRNSRFAA